ncbi:MAG: TMEM43 family protein [Campylobacterota bacterium]|nr:TMEM43 family protein [Campylobacterota bacterium]
MDTITQTTRTSYGKNIGNSFKGVAVGFALIIASITLLWWNEGRSVDQATALQEMQSNIVTLANTKYDAQHEGKAVLLQGEVKPLSEVVDPEFGVRSDGLVLRKTVQMYQWKENKTTHTEEKVGGSTQTTTTYDYVKEWSSTAINSSTFQDSVGHQNPMMNHKSETYATDAQLGEYYLDKNMIRRIGASQSYHGLAKMPEQIGEAINHKNFLYIGFSAQLPRVGDVKITYSYAPAGIYTFAAKSQNKALVNYTTDNGKSFAFVRPGNVDAKIIFKEELEANNVLTWILRGVGLMLMFIGFSLIMGPLATLVKVIPMFSSIMTGVTSIVAGILTLILGSLVIALSWFGSRPILSVSILLIAIGIAVAMSRMNKKTSTTSFSKEEESTPPPPPPRSPQEEGTPPPRSPREEGTPPPPPPPRDEGGSKV